MERYILNFEHHTVFDTLLLGKHQRIGPLGKGRQGLLRSMCVYTILPLNLDRTQHTFLLAVLSRTQYF